MSGDEEIERAAEVLRAGGVVAFPTETVYGLGAEAGNEMAVRRIFAIKGRPTAHPLIVHLSDARELPTWVIEVPSLARRLAERFWPGPLTIILRRGEKVLDAVTGGLPTVALRVPNHPIALRLLRALGGGLAAPSANRFGAVSPTTAEHVRQDLGDAVDLILDGGPCQVGLESTIVDLSSGHPTVLRPGGVSREELEEAVGAPVPLGADTPVRSPGQLAHHYAPRAEVILVTPGRLAARAAALQARGLRVAVCTGEAVADVAPAIERVVLPRSTEEIARTLYAALREVDRRGCDVVLLTVPPETGLGLAIGDRLRRATRRGAIVTSLERARKGGDDETDGWRAGGRADRK